MHMKCHLPGVIWDPFRLHLVHIGKLKNQPFWRCQPTYLHTTQPSLPKFGEFFCLCTIGLPKRLFFLFSNMYEMKPDWVPNDPRWVAFHVHFFAESYFQMKCGYTVSNAEIQDFTIIVQTLRHGKAFLIIFCLKFIDHLVE